MRGISVATVFVFRFTYHDAAGLHEIFLEREPLRRRFGCTQARLMVDTRAPGTFLAFLEFPSFERAQAYVTQSSLESGGEMLANVGERLVGYFQDLGPTDSGSAGGIEPLAGQPPA